jgi:hypothetical protein
LELLEDDRYEIERNARIISWRNRQGHSRPGAAVANLGLLQSYIEYQYNRQILKETNLGSSSSRSNTTPGNNQIKHVERD